MGAPASFDGEFDRVKNRKSGPVIWNVVYFFFQLGALAVQGRAGPQSSLDLSLPCDIVSWSIRKFMMTTKTTMT